MEEKQIEEAPNVPERFAYFSLRVNQPDGGVENEAPLSGTIEHLGRHEKSRFQGLNEMCELLTGWLTHRGPRS